MERSEESLLKTKEVWRRKKEEKLNLIALEKAAFKPDLTDGPPKEMEPVPVKEAKELYRIQRHMEENLIGACEIVRQSGFFNKPSEKRELVFVPKQEWLY